MGILESSPLITDFQTSIWEHKRLIPTKTKTREPTHDGIKEASKGDQREIKESRDSELKHEQKC